MKLNWIFSTYIFLTLRWSHRKSIFIIRCDVWRIFRAWCQYIVRYKSSRERIKSMGEKPRLILKINKSCGIYKGCSDFMLYWRNLFICFLIKNVKIFFLLSTCESWNYYSFNNLSLNTIDCEMSCVMIFLSYSSSFTSLFSFFLILFWLINSQKAFHVYGWCHYDECLLIYFSVSWKYCMMICKFTHIFGWWWCCMKS